MSRLVRLLVGIVAALVVAGCGMPAQCAPCFGGMTVTLLGLSEPTGATTMRVCLGQRCRAVHVTAEDVHAAAQGSGPVVVSLHWEDLDALGFDWSASNGRRLSVRFRDAKTGDLLGGAGVISSGDPDGTCTCPYAETEISPERLTGARATPAGR
jgi:hypothetical protein